MEQEVVQISSPGLTSSEQQARTQSLSDRTTRASMAVVGLFNACLTLTMTFWCCLEKHVSGSTADTGSDVIRISTAPTSSPSVHEGRPEDRGVMSADLHKCSTGQNRPSWTRIQPDEWRRLHFVCRFQQKLQLSESARKKNRARTGPGWSLWDQH